MASEMNANQVLPDQPKTNDIESTYSANEMSNNEEIKDLHMQKQMRRLAYVTAIVMLLIVVILAFALTIMRITSPKFRIHSVRVESLVIRNDTSLGLRLGAEVSVKNMNFGHFNYEESSVEFEYGGEKVGEVSVGEGKAGARSAKERIVVVDLEIKASPSLKSDVRLGFLRVKSKGKLSGKVYLLNLEMFKKEKSVEMNCTIVINLATKSVHDLKCD